MVLPVNGSREALFAIAHSTIDASRPDPLVLCPNPFYQIYEGAAYLAGASPYFVNSDPARNFAPDYSAVPDAVWARVQLLYVCSPGNPTGAVLALDDWRELFALSDRHGFVIAADECYSEIYSRATPPLGALEAAHQLGRSSGRASVCQPGRVLEPVEALERAGHALRFRRGRPARAEEIPALPHLQRRRDVAARAGGLDRGLGRRDPRAGQPRAVQGKIPPHHAAAAPGDGCRTARRRLLPVGRRQPHQTVRHRVRTPAVRRI